MSRDPLLVPLRLKEHFNAHEAVIVARLSQYVGTVEIEVGDLDWSGAQQARHLRKVEMWETYDRDAVVREPLLEALRKVPGVLSVNVVMPKSAYKRRVISIHYDYACVNVDALTQQVDATLVQFALLLEDYR